MFTYISQRLFALLLVGMLLLGSILAYIYNIQTRQTSPDIFWNALGSSMSTKGVTCTINKDAGGRRSMQSVALDLASKANARTQTTLSAGGSTVITESIVTRQADYVRYTGIQSDNTSLKTDDVIGVWGKRDREAEGSASLFDQTAMGGCIVPLANLSEAQKDSFLSELRKNEIIRTDIRQSKWKWRFDQPVREYTVRIAPTAYVTFMKRVADSYGLSGLKAINAEAFSTAGTPSFTFVVRANKHTLESIRYNDGTTTIAFDSYGIVPDTAPPARTIPAADLEKRLQSR